MMFRSIILVGLCIFNFIPSLAFSYFTIPVVENSSHTLGRGYNLVTGVPGTECVEVTRLHSIGNNDQLPEGTNRLSNGQWIYRKISVAKDSAELRSSLGVEAQASFGFFGAGMDAAVKYVNESKKNSSNLYVVIYSKVTNNSEVMDHYRLTQTGRDLAAQNPMEFYRRCGDSFIGGRTTGGEFWHVLKIETSSSSQKRKFESKIKAHGLGWDARALIKNTIDEIRSQSRVSAETFKRRSVMSLPSYDDLNANFQFADELATYVRSDQDHSTLAFIALHYNVVADMPILTPALERQRRNLIKLAEASDEAYKRLQLAEEIQRDKNGFDWSKANISIDGMSDYRTQMQEVVNQIDAAAEKCFENPEGCRNVDIRWNESILPTPKTEKEIQDEKKLVGVKLEFHTTNQELDHDSMFTVELVKASDRTLIGRYALNTDHGKRWTDWTTNVVHLNITAVMNDVVSGDATKLLLHMFPAGNNNWNFYIVGHLFFADNHEEIFTTAECQIRGRGSKTEHRTWNLAERRWE